MEEKTVKQNLKLGAFVIGGIVLFLIALFYLGREDNMFNKTFMVSAVFKNVEGLGVGDNVWLSGVKIGTVKRVQIISEGQVLVSLSLKDKQNEFIKTNATAYVGSDGLVGNKIVVIRPGDAATVIHDNDTINSYSPADTQELLNIAKDVGTNAKSITDDLKLISSRLNSGQGVIGELLKDGPLANDLRQTMAALRSTGENASQLTRDAKKIMKEVNEGDGLLTKLINDTTYAVTFDHTLENIGKVGENAKKMSEDLQSVVDKMNSKNNAVGVLLADTTFAENLKTTLGNAKSASYKLDENMEALQHNFLFRGYFRRQARDAEKNK